MDNIVIHYYEGESESFPGIEVTIKSLREVYSGKVIFLYKNISTKLKDFLIEQNIQLVDCDKYEVLFKTSPYNNKIIYTYLFLRDLEHDLSNTKILFCDVGDVYFTASPFSIESDKLLFAIETNKITSCDVNKTWLNICYGEEVTKTIENNIVINSGVILGTYSQIKSLFKSMVEDMAVILTKINYPITDQAIVNKLVYYNKIECELNKTDIANFSQSPDLDLTYKINHQYKVNKKHTKFLYDKYTS